MDNGNGKVAINYRGSSNIKCIQSGCSQKPRDLVINQWFIGADAWNRFGVMRLRVCPKKFQFTPGIAAVTYGRGRA